MGHGARGLQRSTATPGTISRTITRAAAPIAGARTASAALATSIFTCASALALWNERDPILKERLFGLTNAEGNHGEDVKELYYYLDGTPTHSYMRMLYKYPQAAFPYAHLVEENRRRSARRAGIRADRYRHLRRRALFRRRDRIRQGRHRRHPDAGDGAQPRPRRGAAAPVCRSSGRATSGPGSRAPRSRASRPTGRGGDRMRRTRNLPPMRLVCDGAPELLFCDNETNAQPALWASTATGFPKDGINDFVVAGDRGAVNPERVRHQGGGALPLRPCRPAGSPRPAAAAARRRRRGFDDFAAVLRSAPRRGRRILRRAASRHRRCRGAAGAAPGPGRHAVVEAVLLLRRSPLAARRPAAAAAARRAPARPQRRLAAPVQLRRHLDAGQVGISLVRRLGPRLSLRRAGA